MRYIEDRLEAIEGQLQRIESLLLATVEDRRRAPAATDARKQKLFSLKETAEMCGISLSTLNRLVAAGTVKPVRLGRKVLISRKDVERIVAGRTDGETQGIKVPSPAGR